MARCTASLRTSLFTFLLTHLLIIGCFIFGGVTTAHAVIPYSFNGPAVIGEPGNVLPAPDTVIGKEFSDSADRQADGVGDPGQIISWDGAGGVADGIDYTGAIPGIQDGQIDAVSHRRDLLYESMHNDTSYLLFSTGNGASPLGTGSLTTTEGEIIGLAGDINYEAPGSISKGIWAAGPQIDGMTIPFDVDGLEIWGPEPPGSDADRFSYASDVLTGVSVFTANGQAYVNHATVTTAVESLLGSLPTFLDTAIDLDALMTRDVSNDEEFGPGDSITFSIRQIRNGQDPDGFYATGSELFRLDATAAGGFAASFVSHGGHVWDHAYALAAMKEGSTGRQLDINAIEAISAVPEPSAFLFLSVLACLGSAKRRLRWCRLSS